jgi:hypothetical protein
VGPEVEDVWRKRTEKDEEIFRIAKRTLSVRRVVGEMD